MLQFTKITTSNLNWTETHTILQTFLGSTQEAHMGASCVLPSVTSLTGRSVVKIYDVIDVMLHPSHLNE